MQRLDFNTGWHFSCPDGRDFDVTLPHDAMLNTPRNTEPGFTWFLLAGWRGVSAHRKDVLRTPLPP